MDYHGFVINEKEVLTGDIAETEYTISGSAIAYQIIDPKMGYILGTYSDLEQAKQAIDRNGERWRALPNQ